MNRRELTALVAEMQQRNPDLEITLAPRLTAPRGLLRDQFHQVEVTIRVTQRLQFAPNDPTSVETVREMMQDEIDALREGTGERARAIARHTRLLRERGHNPIAQRLLEAPLAVTDPDVWQPPPTRSLQPFVNIEPSPQRMAAPMQIRFPLTDIEAELRDQRPTAPIPATRDRPHLMLRPPVSVPIEPGGPRRPVTIPEGVPTEKPVEAVPQTLWERLEGD